MEKLDFPKIFGLYDEFIKHSTTANVQFLKSSYNRNGAHTMSQEIMKMYQTITSSSLESNYRIRHKQLMEKDRYSNKFNHNAI